MIKSINKYNLAVKAACSEKKNEDDPHYARRLDLVHLFSDGSTRATDGHIYFQVSAPPNSEKIELEEPIALDNMGEIVGPTKFPSKPIQTPFYESLTIILNLELLQKLVKFVAECKDGMGENYLHGIKFRFHQSTEIVEFYAGKTPEGQSISGYLMPMTPGRLDVDMDDPNAGGE
jgi:hypothetical protein